MWPSEGETHDGLLVGPVPGTTAADWCECEASARYGRVRPRQERADMNRAQAEPAQLPAAARGAPQSLELRHLRYFVALADAGCFTKAAEQLFIAQPTLSQQIRRLEEIVGTPLMHRRRAGLKLTAAGRVLLDASRNVLCLVDHEVSRTRQTAGLGRLRLRIVIPSGLPEGLAVTAAAGLLAAAAAADVDVDWLETAGEPVRRACGHFRRRSHRRSPSRRSIRRSRT